MNDNMEPLGIPEDDALEPTNTTSQKKPEHSVDASQLESLSARLEQTERLVKSLQSVKDKRVDQVRTDVDDLKRQIKRITELQAKGYDESAIARELQIDALLQGQPHTQDASVPSGNAPGTSAPKASSSVSDVLNLAGLSANSPDVVEILRSTSDPLEQIAKIYQLHTEKKAQAANQPAPTGTPLPSGVTGAPANSGDREAQLVAELEALTNDPTASPKKIKELNAELIKIISAQ